MGMIDVGEKKIVKRKAEAAGKIILSKHTIMKIKEGQIKKGDPLPVAEIAAMNAAKQTHILIPHCHQIALDYVNVFFDLSDEIQLEARCTVGAKARTGVEMEALVGVTAALNTIWDMVKYLEKDKNGQYPGTKITDVRVIAKIKESS
ncbi:cyclic pyranopterin monophosphate synthase MoaC [Thermodesulfobacteriota bacterium]